MKSNGSLPLEIRVHVCNRAHARDVHVHRHCVGASIYLMQLDVFKWKDKPEADACIYRWPYSLFLSPFLPSRSLRLGPSQFNRD